MSLKEACINFIAKTTLGEMGRAANASQSINPFASVHTISEVQNDIRLLNETAPVEPPTRYTHHLRIVPNSQDTRT